MRYGIVRQFEGHPPLSVQRRLVEDQGADLVIEDKAPTRASLRAQRKLLLSLKAGDCVLVPSLDTLKMSTGELAEILHAFEQTGISLRIVGREPGLLISPGARAATVLALLAENEKLRPEVRRAVARRRPKIRPLTRYQIDYANDLRRHGASLRMIGLLFQMSPDDLLGLLGPPPPRTAPQSLERW